MDNQEFNLKVSPICSKNGERFAYVSFENGNRFAEGRIPDCTIVSSKGFSNAELDGLVAYMKSDLGNLKDIAASIDVLGAIIKN